MFVKNMMIPNHECVTAQEDTTLTDALEKLEKNEIDGVPVLQWRKVFRSCYKIWIYESYFQSDKQKDEYLNSTYS